MDLVTLAGDSLETGHRSWGRVVRPFLYPGVRPAILCPVPDLIVVDDTDSLVYFGATISFADRAVGKRLSALPYV